ncbi:MAG: hypothetical protein IJS54_05210 [Desulfovibrio sp.]|nr:hypothetical protein [Desulfovibrio sp.]
MLQLDACSVAWKRMLEERTCPPVDILRGGGADVEAHLKGCSRCRERMETLDAVYSVCRAEVGVRKDAPKTAGAVCRLKRDAFSSGIHDEHGWHNPPLVLILPDETGVDGMVRVAQIHDASELAGPGDFPLTGKYADCFAESWNTWPAFTDTLEWRGVVSEDIAARVSTRARSPMPQIEEDTTVFWFRRQELSIGGFFGRIAAARGLRILEGESKTVRSARVLSLGDWDKGRVRTFIHHWEHQPLAAAAAGADGGRPSRALLLSGDALDNGVWAEANVDETIFNDIVSVNVTVSLPEKFANAKAVSARAFTATEEEWRVVESPEIEDGKVFATLELSASAWEKAGKPVPMLALQFDSAEASS